MVSSLIKTGSMDILNKGGNGLSLTSKIPGVGGLSKIAAATEFFEKNGGLVKYPSEVAFLIDDSASMSGGENAITTGMNEFLETIPNSVNITLAKFSENIRFLWEGVPSNKLKLENYRSCGKCTYLNDSIVSFMEKLVLRKAIHGNNLSSFIISDGADSIVEALDQVLQTKKMVNITEIMDLLSYFSDPDVLGMVQSLSQNSNGFVDITEVIKILEMKAIQSISAALKSGHNLYFFGDNELLVGTATRLGIPRGNIAVYDRSVNGLIALFRSSNVVMQQMSNPTTDKRIKLTLQQTYNRLLVEGGK